MKPLAEAEHLVESQGVDHLNHKFFRAHVAQPRRRIALLDGMPDGMHQVRLTHSPSTVKKQRIVRFRWLLRDRSRSRMRKFVRLADHKRVKRVARVRLMIAAFKIQPRLFHRSRCGGGRRGHRLFFGADILHPHRRNAELVKNSLHDFAVRARQHLAKDGGGNLDINYVPIRAIQPGRLKPGVESIDADSGFYVF